MLVVTIFLTATNQEEKKGVSFKNVFDEAVNIVLTLNLWVHVFMQSVTKWEVHIEYVCYLLNFTGFLKKRYLHNWSGS